MVAATVGVGVASNNVEYFDEPAMAVMLCELPSDQYRVFSGVSPLNLGFDENIGGGPFGQPGSYLAAKIDGKKLKTSFGWFVLAMAIVIFIEQFLFSSFIK